MEGAIITAHSALIFIKVTDLQKKLLRHLQVDYHRWVVFVGIHWQLLDNQGIQASVESPNNDPTPGLSGCIKLWELC